MINLQNLKPGELLRHALKCFEAVEQDHRYSVFMYATHRPEGDGCEVNLPGAVMAKSLGVGPYRYMEIGDIPDPDHRAALWALNHFQFGRVREGLKQLDPAMDCQDTTDVGVGVSGEGKVKKTCNIVARQQSK